MCAPAAVHAQTEAFPTLHLTKTAGTPQSKADFGWSGAAGKLGGPIDTHDDLVVTALLEDNLLGMADVGAAYVFEDEVLAEPSNPLMRFRLRRIESDVHLHAWISGGIRTPSC